MARITRNIQQIIVMDMYRNYRMLLNNKVLQKMTEMGSLHCIVVEVFVPPGSKLEPHIHVSSSKRKDGSIKIMVEIL